MDEDAALRRRLAARLCPELALEPWQMAAIAYNAASSLAGAGKRVRTGPGITEEQVRGVLARFRREIAVAAQGDETDRVAMANRIRNGTGAVLAIFSDDPVNGAIGLGPRQAASVSADRRLPRPALAGDAGGTGATEAVGG